jgi:CYTH domain-containing protein
MTVRRRFLLASSFARLIRRDRGGVRQVEGFFPAQQDRASWVRLEEGSAFLILRTIGSDGKRDDETEVPVPHAHALLDVCAGEVGYIRTKLPIGDRAALIDEVIQPRSLHLVTVDFADEDEARGFQPLPWFGPEVTGDARYTYQAIALEGLNEVPDLPLSNAALNSLLDTLENCFAARQRIPASGLTARQVAVTQAKITAPVQGQEQSIKVDPAEIEAAMMREMQLTHQNTQS